MTHDFRSVEVDMGMEMAALECSTVDEAGKEAVPSALDAVAEVPDKWTDVCEGLLVEVLDVVSSLFRLGYL